MQTVALTIGSGLFLTALAVSGMGCAGDVATDSAKEGTTDGAKDGPVSRRSSALSSTDYFDSTGLVHIRVNTCDFGPYQEKTFTTCDVDSGFVLVGGGAEVEGSADGGGLLTMSLPGGQAWFAASKDHDYAYSHRIRAYSIGMSLAGMTQEQLAGLVHWTASPVSLTSNRPTATVTIPDGDILLSGGGLLDYQGAGVLLTESYPSSNSTWTVSAKDHVVADDTGSIAAVALSIPACLNNIIPRCLGNDILSKKAWVATGYGLATVDTPSGSVPTGVGGRARWNVGRLLTDIFPTNAVGGPGATAYSKDHLLAEGNFTDVWGISIHGL